MIKAPQALYCGAFPIRTPTAGVRAGKPWEKTMHCEIKGKEYFYTTAVREHPGCRGSFDRLSGKVFGLSFEDWYRSGYWGGEYIPHTLFDGEKAVANVSVNLMHTVFQGQEKRYIQLGTVMTDPRCRGRGLARWLLEKVLSEYADKCDAVYLFANDGVLDFYPKFGFAPAEQYRYSLPVNKASGSVKRLDMSKERDRAILLDRYRCSNPFSALPMLDNPGLLMFASTKFLRDDVYYLEDSRTIVIASFEGQSMTCFDIYGAPGQDLQEVLSAAAREETKTVRLGFSPVPCGFGEPALFREENTTLFLWKDKENLFAENKLMFPLLSHA